MELDISDNQFLSFPSRTIPPALERLYISGTVISCLPVLPQTLESLFLDTFYLNCLPNNVPGLTITTGSPIPGYYNINLPICNTTNNVFGCNAFPVIKGKAFYDLNNNGIKDASEPVKANLKISLSNGAYTFTNNSGNYQFLCNDTGRYKLSCLPGQLFKAVPDTSSFLFNRYDTTVVLNLVLQKLVSKDSVFMSVTPLQRARPGFNFSYMINYENAGSTNLSATSVVLNYNTTLLTYTSVSNGAVINSGSSLSLNLSSLPVGQAGSFIANFTVKPTAVIGSALHCYTVMSNSNASCRDTTQIIINGSFDPNDKNATPAVTPQEVITGKKIDYLIRFQNTGTDTAFNIVITDTLSSMLQAGTLEIVSASHPCIATIKNNIISFEMRNILLSDHIVNEPLNHGFIHFRIRVKTNLIAGNVINNKAAIYFDYNSPIITNTAATEVKTLTTTPLQLISFIGNSTITGEALLNWKTHDENNTAFFAIEASGDARNFINKGQVAAAGSGNHDYRFSCDLGTSRINYFRLKMMDRDGKFTYSNMISIHGSTIDKAGFAILSNPVKINIVLNGIDPDLINTPASLINNMGVIVKEFMLTSATQSLNVENLPAGHYYLKTNLGVKKLTLSR